MLALHTNLFFQNWDAPFKNSVSLTGRNPNFLANTFSTPRIIDESQKVKLPSHINFSLGTKVIEKVEQGGKDF